MVEVNTTSSLSGNAVQLQFAVDTDPNQRVLTVEVETVPIPAADKL